MSAWQLSLHPSAILAFLLEFNKITAAAQSLTVKSDNVYTKRVATSPCLGQGKKSFPEVSADFPQPKIVTCLFLNQSLARGMGLA